FTSTRHRRQAPGAVSPSIWHSVGSGMPFSRHRSRMVSSSCAPMSRPSILSVLITPRVCLRIAIALRLLLFNLGGLHSQRPVDQLVEVLLLEVAQCAHHRLRRGLAQPAQAGVAYQVAQLLEQLQVAVGGLAV